MTIKSKDEKICIGALLDFCIDSSDLSDDEIDSALSDDGIDTKMAWISVQNKINSELYGKSWKEIALDKRQKMISVKNELGQSFESNKDTMLAWLKEMISSGKLQTQHRDFKNLTDNDLESIIEDAEFLRLFDESQNKS